MSHRHLSKYADRRVISVSSHVASSYRRRYSTSDNDEGKSRRHVVPSSRTREDKASSSSHKRKLKLHEDYNKDKVRKSDHGSSRRTEREKHRRHERHEESKHKVKTSSRLREKIDEIVRKEHHHIVLKERDSSGNFLHVEWCPKYVRPDTGRATGGTALLHHTCRSCKNICLHLLGRYGSSDRKCLVCVAADHGWHKSEVPEWYFHHHRCKYCRTY